MSVDSIVAQEIRAAQWLRQAQWDFQKVAESYFGKAAMMQFLTDYPYRVSATVRSKSLERCLEFVEHSLPYAALQHKYAPYVVFRHDVTDFVPGVSARLSIVMESWYEFESWVAHKG